MKHLIIVMLLTACESAQHKREYLQRQNPECIVSADFKLICPAPVWENPKGSLK